MSKRKVGIDILRIISMLEIIILHLIGNGGIFSNISNNITYIVILILYAICFTSVNVFGILSGYLMWNKKKTNSSRLIKLLLIMVFYSAIITIIFYLFNIYNIRNIQSSRKDLLLFFLNGSQIFSKYNMILYSFFPPLIGRYWYITCYILLYLLVPYINIFVQNVNKKKFKNLIVILFVLFSILSSVLFNVDFFRINNGYSPFWLMFCYLIGAYMGKYEQSIKFNKKKFSLIALVCLISSISLNFLIKTIFKFVYNDFITTRFIDYISPFIVILSIYFVLAFKDIELNNSRLIKIIKYLSINSFSVYIIHCHYLIYDIILKNSFVFSLKYNPMLILLILIFSSLLIYLLCIIIDFIRVLIFKIFDSKEGIKYV